MNGDSETSTSTGTRPSEVGAATSGAGAAGEAPLAGGSPASEIEKLRELLEQEQANRKAAELKIQQAEAQIAALGQVTEDIGKIVTEYGKEHAKLADARTDHTNYLIDERKCLENVLGDAKDDVEMVVDPFEDAISNLEVEVQEDTDALDQLREARGTAAKARDEKKKDFESLKGTAAALKAAQAQLDAAAREVKTAHDAGEFAIAYWQLVYGFKRKLEGAPQVVAPEDFETALTEARDAYVAAIADFYEADTAVKQAERALEVKKADLAELKKNKDADIRRELSKIEPMRDAA